MPRPWKVLPPMPSHKQITLMTGGVFKKLPSDDTTDLNFICETNKLKPSCCLEGVNNNDHESFNDKNFSPNHSCLIGFVSSRGLRCTFQTFYNRRAERQKTKGAP